MNFSELTRTCKNGKFRKMKQITAMLIKIRRKNEKKLPKLEKKN